MTFANAGWALAALIYAYAGWAFAEAIVASPTNRSRKPVMVFGYWLMMVAWPLLMPWIPRRGNKNFRRKMGA